MNVNTPRNASITQFLAALALIALLFAACAPAGASTPMPQPRELTVPASCTLLDFNARAYGTSWNVDCAGDASVVVGGALTAAGWQRCSGTPDPATYRKGQLVTTLSPVGSKRAQLAQFSAGNECT